MMACYYDLGVVVWCGLVWSGVGWYGLVWVGVGWCGLVWVGVFWCGLVWPGVGRCDLAWVGVAWCVKRYSRKDSDILWSILEKVVKVTIKENEQEIKCND